VAHGGRRGADGRVLDRRVDPDSGDRLLPLVLFPALGLGDIRESAAPFANPIIFLFLGGFIIALGMQRWHLHRRVAIGLIGVIGTGLRPSSRGSCCRRRSSACG
jgi:hypothetical protein